MSDIRFKRINVEIPADLHQKVRLQAISEGKTLGRMIESMSIDYLKRQVMSTEKGEFCEQ